MLTSDEWDPASTPASKVPLGVPVCFACGASRKEEAWVAPGHGSQEICRSCYLHPDFDEGTPMGYREWGDLWAIAYPARAKDRRLRVVNVNADITREWRSGDVLEIPGREGLVAFGQALWVHPSHYRVHIAFQNEMFPLGSAPPSPPRPDAILRTVDTLLVHRIWRIVGHSPLPPGVGGEQVVGLDSRLQPVAIDRLTRSPVGKVDPSLPSLTDYDPFGAVRGDLLRGPHKQAAHTHHFRTRDAVDVMAAVARRADMWREPGQPPRSVRTSRTSDPWALWRPPSAR